MEEVVKRPKIFARRSFLREAAETILLIVGIYTLVNLATARFVVEGRSMYPSFEGEEFLIVSRVEYLLGDPQRGDIIVFHYPNNPERDFIKRLVGLPGEYIRMEDGHVFVNGVPIEEPYVNDLCSSSICDDKDWFLGEDEYFVLGDNRNASQDSTRFGPVNRKYIIGRAWVKYWPPEDWGIIKHHDYEVEIPDEIPPMTPTPTPIPESTVPPMFDSSGG